jgi:putative ABC transport system ATP-binding protein
VPPADSEPLIQLAGITKTYELGEIEVHALRGVSIDVEIGELVAVMGASGSGKSTLLNLIGCLDQPSSGRYLLQSMDVSSLNKRERAGIRNSVIGFVFQSFNLLPRTTALENVELPLIYAGVGRKERMKLAREALERVGLIDRMLHVPSQLSGGQQQRVALARALVNRPRLILADEPTGNLDSKTSLEVMALLQELGGSGITIVVVTHEPDIAEFATRRVLVKDGLISSDQRQTARRAFEMLEARA